MNSDTYTDLYAAIFKLAVIDDTKKTMDLIVKDLETMGLERSKALRLASTVKKKVSDEIKEIIYEEAKKWPETKRSTSTENLIKIKNKYMFELGRKNF